jgi:adhesin/invasin
MKSSLKDRAAGRLRLATVLAALVGTTAACGETTASEPVGAATINVSGDAARAGTAGAPLADPIEVVVLGTDGQPLRGVQVTFSPSGAGASVEPAAAVTDERGVARTRWTLSREAGSSTLTITSGSASAQVTATGATGPAAAVTGVAGVTQTGVVGGTAQTPPAVRVLDAHGNAVRNATVTFSVQSGGGSVSDFVRVTDAEGVATLGSWTFGATPGVQVVLGRVEHSGVTGNPVTFTAVVTGGAAAQLEALSATSQTALVATAVAVRPSVRVTDAFGNPVANATVTFAVAEGGGQVSGATQTTNAQGVATVGGWTLGPAVGPNRLTATVAGAGTVSFSAAGTAGAASQLVLSAGNDQTAQVLRAVAVPPRVIARDAGGNPVAGVVVTFAVTGGGGTVVGGRQVTDAAGIAEVGGWFMGTSAGTNTLSASAPGLQSVFFTATATPGQPSTMVAVSATTQTGVAGGTVNEPPRVQLRDNAGNPVPGVSVTFTVAAGGGALTAVAGGTAQTTVTTTTDASGTAAVATWRLGPQTGTNQVVASASGVPSVTFTATAGAGAPASVAATSVQTVVAVQGTQVETRPTVMVVDANGNPIQGARVVFAITAGSGAITGAVQETDAAGTAIVGSWILGPEVPNTLIATVTDAAGNQLNITNNPVEFTGQSATALQVLALPTEVARGTNFFISVQLVDLTGNPVLLSGVPLTIEIATGGGTLNGTATVNTSSSGIATFTLNVTGDAGARTFTITSPGIVPVTTAPITFN